jgi:hypothetical protein
MRIKRCFDLAKYARWRTKTMSRLERDEFLKDLTTVAMGYIRREYSRKLASGEIEEFTEWAVSQHVGTFNIPPKTYKTADDVEVAGWSHLTTIARHKVIEKLARKYDYRQFEVPALDSALDGPIEKVYSANSLDEYEAVETARCIDTFIHAEWPDRSIKQTYACYVRYLLSKGAEGISDTEFIRFAREEGLMTPDSTLRAHILTGEKRFPEWLREIAESSQRILVNTEIGDSND